MNEIQIIKKDIKALSTTEKKSLVLWASEIQAIQKNKDLSSKQKKHKFREINKDIKFKDIKGIITNMILNYLSEIKENNSLVKKIKNGLYISSLCIGGLALAGLTTIAGASFLSIFLISTIGSVFVNYIIEHFRK